MSEAVNLARALEGERSRPSASYFVGDEAPHDLIPLAFRLELQSMPALLSVLTTVARLGGCVTYVLAAELLVSIRLLAPGRVAHRIQLAFEQLVEVVAVSATDGAIRQE